MPVASGRAKSGGWPASSCRCMAMEHHYLITEDIPEVLASPKEQLHVIDFDGEIYMRQEGKGGMLIGTYERAGVPWSERQTPWNFGHELLPNDLERIAPSLEVGFSHYPALGRAGIKKVINGPFTFTPDGNPLVGPVRGLKNYWVACGVMAGLSQGGGVGLALSNWMVDGDPGADIWGMDVARYGDWTTMAYTNAKVRENYSRRWRVRFPNEELPAARGVKTTPIFDSLPPRARSSARLMVLNMRRGLHLQAPTQRNIGASSAPMRLRRCSPRSRMSARMSVSWRYRPMPNTR